MKKHKGTKIVVILSFVFIICGSLLLGAGLIQGGSLRYLSVNSNTVSWWPFPFGNIGVGFWDEDFDNDSTDFTGTGWKEQELGNVTSVYMDINVADIDITRGSTNKISYQVRNSNNLSIQEDNGKVTIVLKHQNSFKNNGGRVRIQLKDEIYEKIDIECAVGEVSIDQIKTKDLRVKADLGSINLEDIYSENAVIEEKCGEINIDGTLLGRSEISNDLGSTEVNIIGNPQDYRYEVKNSLGNTQVMENDHAGSANLTGGNSNAKNYVTIKNSLGDIELEFE